MRVFELAKKLGLESKDLVLRLIDLGLPVKSHMSALDDDQVTEAEKALKKKAKPRAKPPAKEKAPKAKAKTKAPKAKAKTKAPKTAEKEAKKKAPATPNKKETKEKAPEAAKVPKTKKKAAPKTPPAQVEKKPIAPRKKPAAPKAKVKPEKKPPEEKPVGKPPKKLMPSRTAVPQAAPIEVPPVASFEPDAPKVSVRAQPVADTKIAPTEKAQVPSAEKRTRVVTFKKRDRLGRPKPRTGPAGRRAEAAKAPPKAEDAQEKPESQEIEIDEAVTVGELAQKLGLAVNDFILELMDHEILASKNQKLDVELAKQIGERHGFAVRVTTSEEYALLAEEKDDPSSLVPRAPVVTIMGHVDHGKTSLLDVIRKTRVTESEVGGITQHIGAYRVELGKRSVVFLDTPGHEAFTAMRARGAQVTDVVVLVVAADDGVMPQTVEAIHHARAAKVPIVVAINKIDKPDANPDRVKQELSKHDLVPEEWAGKTIMVAVSAQTGEGIDNLLEMLLLEAELLELKANPDKRARGTVIEAKIDRGLGPVATVLIQSGTLRLGDAFITGKHYGKVRALLDEHGKKTGEAQPATPVQVLGLSGVPDAGDSFICLEDEKRGRHISEARQSREREKEAAAVTRVTLEDLYNQMQAGKVEELNVVLKGDVHGSLEAARDSLLRLSCEEVKLKVIHEAVGEINESDVILASASNAIILGFHVSINPRAEKKAQVEKVDVRTYGVIYELVDDVRAAMEGLLAPEMKESVEGHAEIRRIFKSSTFGTIGGSYVLDGEIRRDHFVRVKRGEDVVYEGRLASLRREKDDVRQVSAGFECGIRVDGYDDIQIEDILETYIQIAVERKLQPI